MRWTPLTVDSFTPVSDFFLDYYSRLQPPLKAAEAMFVVHLMSYKWDKNAPFPAFKSLAKKMGISDSAARNHARSLTKKGYLHRKMRVGQTNQFHLETLFQALEKIRITITDEQIHSKLTTDTDGSESIVNTGMETAPAK